MFWGATGGVRRVLMAKHERLPALGWRHSIIAPGAQGDGLWDCGGLPLPRSGGYRVVWRRAQAVKQIQGLAPDLIESADPYTLAWASLAAADALRVPAVAFCHSDLPALAARWLGRAGPTGHHSPGHAERAARRYLTALYRHFALVLAPSHGLAERLRAWGVPNVAVQPLGVDCTVFRPQARRDAWRQALSDTLGLDRRTRWLVYSGRFAAEKNLPLLAEAVRRLGPGHVLLAVGNGPVPPTGDHVVCLPPEHDSSRLARLVASADAYVHAGDQETFGLGVLEAMACGTPVVVAAAGGLAELTAGVGQQVHRATPQAWAEAISASLTARRAGREAHCRAAWARAQQQDWPRVMAAWAGRYAAVIGRPAPLAPPGPLPAAAAVDGPSRFARPQLARQPP